MTPRGPSYKFRLLCKRCNSYKHTTLSKKLGVMILRCDHCNIEADSLDETNEPNEWDKIL